MKTPQVLLYRHLCVYQRHAVAVLNCATFFPFGVDRVHHLAHAGSDDVLFAALQIVAVTAGMQIVVSLMLMPMQSPFCK